MCDEQVNDTHTTVESNDSATQEDMEAKRVLARRLMEGDGVDKDEAKAVSLLEDCVADGDADAMAMLAKCCAFGYGIEQSAERANELLSEAAKKGNDDAQGMMEIIEEYEGQTTIVFDGLFWS